MYDLTCPKSCAYNAAMNSDDAFQILDADEAVHILIALAAWSWVFC